MPFEMLCDLSALGWRLQIPSSSGLADHAGRSTMQAGYLGCLKCHYILVFGSLNQGLEVYTRHKGVENHPPCSTVGIL